MKSLLAVQLVVLDFIYKVMKLKLEHLEHGTVLTVSESIEPEQIAVLRAGLTQIFAATARPGKPQQAVLVDLTALGALDSVPGLKLEPARRSAAGAARLGRASGPRAPGRRHARGPG